MQPRAGSDLTLEGVVHDLNNVFETISEAADLLESDPRWSPLAAAVHRSVARGRRIVGSLSEDALATQELESVLDNAIDFTLDYLDAIRAPRVQFQCYVDPDIRLRGAATAWERALFNLFVNAAQAMAEGGVVEVSAQQGEQGTDITVADNGPGISEEILPRIFEPHFSTKSTSAGLGLHIVESIVKRSGGTVTASNRGARPGAIFRIHLAARSE